MSKFKIGDRVRHPLSGDGTVMVAAYGDNDYVCIRRDDGVQGSGPGGTWTTYNDVSGWEPILRNPILDIPEQVSEPSSDSTTLRAIYINTAGVRRAIESGLFPEDSIEECLIGMVEAYSDILEDQFADEDDAVAASAIGWVNEANERETQH